MNLKTALIAVSLSLTTLLAGCTMDGTITTFSGGYSARTDAGYRIPAIPMSKVPSKFHRQIVKLRHRRKAGHDHRRYRRRSSCIIVMDNGKRRSLRHRRRPRRLRVVGRITHRDEARMADMDPALGNDQTPA
jgi:hypothetical protein